MPAMTAIEMPLLRQAIANAFGIAILVAVCCWLFGRAIQSARQLWRRRKLARAFEQSKDRALLSRRALQALSATPGVRIVRKNSR